MVATAKELVDVRRRIEDVIELGHKEFGMDRDPNAVQLIPLIEEVPELLQTGELISTYIAMAREQGYRVDGLRLMFGRSDSAMVYGMVASVLAVKLAIADSYEACAAAGVDAMPIYGGGALPFRGHVTLENIDAMNVDFAGIRTVTIQSGIRYDRGNEDTMQLALRAAELLPETPPLEYDEARRRELLDLIGLFTIPYLKSFSRLLPAVTRLADIMPRQRDRLARKSPVGYARDAAQPGKLASMMSDSDIADSIKAVELGTSDELPRAISYTGALYSIGLPPEIIGTGRGLDALYERGGTEAIERMMRIYPGLKSDLEVATRYLNLSTAEAHLPGELLEEISQDIDALSRHLGIDQQAGSAEDRRYHVLLETVQPLLRQLASRGEDWPDDAADIELVSDWICRLGRLRGSLG
jgi:phosphoenolpyruvate carboxylase